jgi:hypothetical protein
VKALPNGILHINTNPKCVYKDLPMTALRQLFWLQPAAASWAAQRSPTIDDNILEKDITSIQSDLLKGCNVLWYKGSVEEGDAQTVPWYKKFYRAG